MTVGKLERVPLRDVFPHEARDLTRWLAGNPDVLADATGQAMAITASEDQVGSFRADLVGEDDEGNVVVIENQLGKSDHDHLGKLLTYVAGTEAKIGVWIVGNPRPEHVEAVTWLNQANLCVFYLMKIEAVRIGSSDPAPLLTLITGPSEAVTQAGQEKKERSERHKLRYKYWEQLLPISNEKTSLFRSVGPSDNNYISASAGRSGIAFVYRVTQDKTSVELYMNTQDEAENLRIFERLRAEMQNVDDEFRGALTWDEMAGRQACRLRFDIDGGYRSDEGNWQDIHCRLAVHMAKLETSLRPHLEAALR